tara:strand:+ start:265 stop:1212 length:948 start_codon:yes stop_codon:yes gene_type:complete
MADNGILSGVDFDAKTDLTFTKAKVNANGRKQIGILSSKNKKSVHLSTPLMLTWGVNEYTDDNTGNKSYDMALQFPNDEYNNPACIKFLKNMQEFETRVKEDAITNCKDWLNKNKITSDAVDALWTPMLRYPKDKDSGDYDYSRPPTLKVKIPYWEGEYKNVEIYDDKEVQLFPNTGNVFPNELISKGSQVATLISCGGIWVANGKFGITWRLFQAVVKPRVSLAGKCHISLSKQDKDKLINTSANSDDEEVHDEVTNTTLVNDSDDEEVEVVPPSENTINEVKEEVKEEVKSVVNEDMPKKKKVVKKLAKVTTA